MIKLRCVIEHITYQNQDTGPTLTRGSDTFRQGDKVMQIRNNYDKNVFNGDIGYITAVDTNERTLSVTLDSRLVEYDITELDENAVSKRNTKLKERLNMK